MRLKNYKFTKTLRELLDSSGITEIELNYTLYCSYDITHPIQLTYETKVYPFLIGGNEIIAELTCPICGRTHYRLVRFTAGWNREVKGRLYYLSSEILHSMNKRELEAFMGTSINTVLENYRNLWTKYRAKFQDNYSLYCSYKSKLPREKVYTYLIQIPPCEMSSTAKQVLQMNSSYYPIEAFRVALDMIEEQ